jgi:phosphate transport system substrate-binding protein
LRGFRTRTVLRFRYKKSNEFFQEETVSLLSTSRHALAAIFSLSIGASVCAQVSGAGSTLSRDLMARWGASYGTKVGGVTYEAVGSTRGVEHARRAEVDFGVTDIPLTAVGLTQSNLRQMPLAATAVAVIVNVPELSGQALRLNGDILANIYNGKITTWDHSTIRSINPGVKLPGTTIVPIWRADGSGQSYVFSSYLSRQNQTWRRATGASSQLSGLSGRSVVGGSAMLAAVKSTVGAIGYEGYGAARASGIPVASLRNASDQFVSPSENSINEALAKTRWSFGTAENAADLDASPGAGTYPMATVIYALLPPSSASVKKAASYLLDAMQNGDASVVASGFLPLPATAKTALAAKPW